MIFKKATTGLHDIFRTEQFHNRNVKEGIGQPRAATQKMKRPNIIWLVLLTATIALSHRPDDQHASTAKIKIENDGGIIAGFSHSAATAMPYDPYFIHVNDTPHIQTLSLNKK